MSPVTDSLKLDIRRLKRTQVLLQRSGPSCLVPVDQAVGTTWGYHSLLVYWPESHRKPRLSKRAAWLRFAKLHVNKHKDFKVQMFVLNAARAERHQENKPVRFWSGSSEPWKLQKHTDTHNRKTLCAALICICGAHFQTSDFHIDLGHAEARTELGNPDRAAVTGLKESRGPVRGRLSPNPPGTTSSSASPLWPGSKV